MSKFANEIIEQAAQAAVSGSYDVYRKIIQNAPEPDGGGIKIAHELYQKTCPVCIWFDTRTNIFHRLVGQLNMIESAKGKKPAVYEFWLMPEHKIKTL